MGKFLLKPCIHFHLRLTGKIININNDIILNNKTHYDPETPINLNKEDEYADIEVENDMVNNMLSFDFDEYTNSIVEQCLYHSDDR